MFDAKPLLKEALQAEVGLPVDRNIPVVCFIGRLEEQKGPDILVQAIDQFIDEDVQVIILVSISRNGFVCQITFFLVSNKKKVNFIEWNISTRELAKSTWRR